MKKAILVISLILISLLLIAPLKDHLIKIAVEVGASEVIIKIAAKTDKAVEITVSARKYLIPQPQLAAGILYQISEKLK